MPFRPNAFVLAAAVIVALSAMVRFAAAMDGLWFDEIWTLELAGQATSAWGVLTEIRHDNNHFLNTWIVRALGPDRDALWYRLPAVLAGTGTVALAGVLGSSRGRPGLWAMMLTGGSYLLIQYSSEARGYTYAVFFSLLCLWIMESALRRPAWHRELRFGLAAVFGILSHLTFLYGYLSIGIWSLWVLHRRKHALAPLGWTLARFHAVPVLFLAWLYYANVRHLKVGGGPRSGALDVIRETLALAIGGPASGSASVLVALAAAGACVAGVVHLRRAKADAWLFYAAIMVLPALVLVVSGADLLFVRYFLVNVAFVLLLLSRLLAALAGKGGWGRSISLACLGLFLAGNAAHTVRLVTVGRGDYAQAVQMMLDETSGPVMTVAGDQDFRNEKVLSYYHRRSGSRKPMTYFPKHQTPRPEPEWYVVHSRERDFVPRPTIVDESGRRYDLVRHFPYAGLSGWHWAVYRGE